MTSPNVRTQKSLYHTTRKNFDNESTPKQVLYSYVGDVLKKNVIKLEFLYIKGAVKTNTTGKKNIIRLLLS